MSHSGQALEYDITIVGGGMVGLVAALLFATQVRKEQAALRIAVIEAHPPKAAPDENVGLRVAALSLASANILHSCGVWDDILARSLPYTGMCVWQEAFEADTERALRFAAAELGEPELGYIAENDVIRWWLWQQAEQHDAIDLLTVAPDGLQINDTAALLTLDDGTEVLSSLVVGADGANSWTRRQLNVPGSDNSYAQKAIVAHVQSEHSHDNTAWQRFLSTGPVALLPLQDGRCSIVWSCDSERADELLALDDAAFAAELTRATDNVLGDLKCTTPRAAFPLAYAHVDDYTGARFALIGDAAHRIHPLAGQGVNLGLLDAATLADVLQDYLPARFADPGDALMLRRYERRRRRDTDLTLGMMNFLHNLFAGSSADSSEVLAYAGGAGLGVVNAVPPVKRKFAEHAMGLVGDLPVAAMRRTGA